MMTSIPRTCLDKRTFDAVDARPLVTLAPRAREAVVCSCVRARTRCLRVRRARGCDDPAPSRNLGTGKALPGEHAARRCEFYELHHLRAPTRDETRRSANTKRRVRVVVVVWTTSNPARGSPPLGASGAGRRRSRQAVASRHRPSRRVRSTSHTRSLTPFSRARPRRTLERRDKTDRIVARGRRSAAARRRPAPSPRIHRMVPHRAETGATRQRRQRTDLDRFLASLLVVKIDRARVRDVVSARGRCASNRPERPSSPPSSSSSSPSRAKPRCASPARAPPPSWTPVRHRRRVDECRSVCVDRHP